MSKEYHNFRQRIGRLKLRKTNLVAPHKKLAELILYLCDKCKDDPNFDPGKLQWLLFHIDMEAYRRTGTSVTGCTYIKT